DTLGTPVAGAAVTARNVETGLSYATESTEAGDYWLGGLPPGTYEVRAERIGYAPTVRPSVALSVGTTLRMNISLRVRAISLDPIEVVAAPPVVETTESDVSFVLDHERIARLPEESRQFLDLALLAPGATAAPDNPEAVPTTQIGALNAYSVGVLVDGGQLVHGGNNDYAGSFPLLAIREFEVLTGGFAAEFGQAASGVVNAVTRRGTNDFSVESFGLYRNHRLNATGAFEAEKPEYERTHWGLAAGGPLERDRTHFFVAAERRTEDAFETVSTDGAFPALEGTFKVPFESTLVFARLDHRLAPDHDLTLRYGGELSTRRTDVGPSTSCAFFGGGNLASEEYGVEIEKDMHSLLGKHRWSLGGGALNEVTVHWVGTWERRARLTDGPMLKYPSLCTGGNQFAWDTPNHRFELREDVSVVRSGAGGT
ncbi:MAG: TonB-dependent receptor plug domain-containing protein, partial [Gemmatimonadetes bacterium]|nr:TonB-dependent receptor [Gemmatimonadota bacterium]NIR76866.1 TonB-dependent receptor [Gemmatimonadota bacterium]NIT85388.1 TonB-dependent receptor [Gemmatimonadota bacterium]NIU29206.1 TonB-dependent receptor [Gemmatimonadota bacterium]NIU34303.1 TonB-dependent receptor plug domain-containing protein [Gemmatimonadota bacterium]